MPEAIGPLTCAEDPLARPGAVGRSLPGALRISHDLGVEPPVDIEPVPEKFPGSTEPVALPMTQERRGRGRIAIMIAHDPMLSAASHRDWANASIAEHEWMDESRIGKSSPRNRLARIARRELHAPHMEGGWR